MRTVNDIGDTLKIAQDGLHFYFFMETSVDKTHRLGHLGRFVANFADIEQLLWTVERMSTYAQISKTIFLMISLYFYHNPILLLSIHHKNFSFYC